MYLFFVAESSCLDPICNMSIDSVTRQLNVATERIKMLQMQLAQISHTNGNGNAAIRQRTLPNKQRQHHQNVEEIETVL